MATILCKVGNHHVHDDRRPGGPRRPGSAAGGGRTRLSPLYRSVSRLALRSVARRRRHAVARTVTPSSVRHRRSAYTATVEHRPHSAEDRTTAGSTRSYDAVPPFTAVAAAWSAGPGRFIVPAPIFAETMFQL